MPRFLPIALFAFFMALGPSQAQAKLIAIVFDTSGSMNDRYNLPSFGMRMLAATIDGRAGEDRVWVIGFEDYVKACAGPIPEATTLSALSCDTSRLVTRFETTSAAVHANMLNDLEREFRATDVGTPFGPIEVMLDEIAKGIQQDEEAILIVVTDGAYEVMSNAGDTAFDNGVAIPQFQRSFAEHRQRILDAGGSIRAEFLFIDSDGSGEGIVREQGVRDTLLSTFNGDANQGAWHVSGADALWSALVEITARVNDTDRAEQARFIEYEGNAITVNSPLSLSRVVIGSTAAIPASVPRLTDTDFGVATTDDRTLDMRMGSGDRLFKYLQLAGTVEHLWFQNAVPPGQYELTFDGPVDRDTFLLFETNAIAQMQITDPQGNVIVPNGRNEYELFLGQEYVFTTQVLDGVTNPAVVDLDTLPSSLAMFLLLQGANLNTTESMALDLAADLGRYSWQPTQTGRLRASSRVSAGILSPESEALDLVILDATAGITISPIRPVSNCADCADGEIASNVTPGGGADVDVGSFDITAEADIPGEIIIDPAGIPEGYRVVDENGRDVPLGRPLPFEPGETRSFTILRPSEVDVDTLVDGGTDVEITVTPAGPWSGQPVSRPTRIRLAAPPMGMRLVSVTQPITPGSVDGLRVPGGELLRGQFSGQFSLTDLLVAPDNATIDELITVSAPGLAGRLLAFDASFPSSGPHALDVRPSTRFWCLCFLGLGNLVTGTDKVDARVSYELAPNGVVLQSAEAALPMQIPVAHRQTGLSCLLDLLYLLLFAMFVRGVIALMTTNRFPKGAVVEITDGEGLPRFKRLDKGNKVWWKAWFALFTGNPNERRTVEGLSIEATRKGAKVDIEKSAPPWELERMGESFADLKESNPKKTVYRLIWGDRLQNVHRPSLSMRLKRKSSDN